MMQWVLFVPELFYIFMAAVFFSASISRRRDPTRLYLWALTLSGIGVVVTVLSARQEGMLFFDAYRVDLYSQLFKLLIAMGTFWVMFSCRELKGISERQHAEFYFFLSVCTLAMMMLVSAVELLTIYVAIELIIVSGSAY